MKINRQNTDNRKRYDKIKIALMKRYPANTVLHMKTLRTLMVALDIRAKDKRSQDGWIEMLCSPRIYGDAVIEMVGKDAFMVLDTVQMNIEDSILIADLVRV